MERHNTSLPLDSAEACHCWMIAFEAHCRAKSIKDEIDTNTGTSPKTDVFLERCGPKALLKIVSLLPGKNIETNTFGDIKKAIDEYVEPRKRLLIADRTHYLSITQDPGESEVDFLSRLNEAAQLCKWDSLKKQDPTEELVKLSFIAGLKDESLKLKILEKLQAAPSTKMPDIIDFCQMSAQLVQFSQKKSGDGQPSSQTNNFFVQNTQPCQKCNTNHRLRECPAFGKTCHKCGKTNHYAKCCKSAPKHSSKPVHSSYHRRTSNKPSSRPQQQSAHSIDIFTVESERANSLMQTLLVHDTPLEFQLDTGAAISIMSKKQWLKLGSPSIEETSVKPTNFDGSQIKTLGSLQVLIKHENSEPRMASFIVVESAREHGLIGRDLIDASRTEVCTFSVEEKELPTIRGFSASIALIDENLTLKFFKARPVPVHLREQLNKELESLERQGIITPISHSKCASPVVWVKKANGKYRMCIDFKATLNGNIQSDAYPLPTVEEIFSRIGNACRFAKIDLKSAYSQIQLDDQASELSVINTHRGLYRVNRLQMGMKNSSAVFQKCMEQVLKGIQGVVIFQDDVMICAESDRQLKKRLSQVYKRLRDYSVTINPEKCVSPSESLKFLGFVFSASGIQPDPSLTQKIADADVPSSAKELASFLGVVTYFGRFIENFANICAPLHEAKKAESEFQWSEECDRSFKLLKSKLTSAPLLQPFKMSKHTTLTVDASMKAIGAVMTQDGHPVLYASRKLSPTESRYSNIEREALAIVWACKRLEHFLLGKQFMIETDHKPLVYIFGPDQAVKSDISPRLMKFSIKMMHYDYVIQHIKGEKNIVADTLSRVDCYDETKVPAIHFSEPCIPLAELREETKADRYLEELTHRITSGRWGNVTRWERPFKQRALQLTVDNDVIRFGSKVVPPRSLHKRIFEIAHQTHNGIGSTLRLIQ